MTTGDTTETPLAGRMLSDAEWAKLRRRMRLSGRETQVLQCVFADQTDDAIAQTLGISPKTVRTHLERLFRKCGYRSGAGAVVLPFPGSEAMDVPNPGTAFARRRHRGGAFNGTRSQDALIA